MAVPTKSVNFGRYEHPRLGFEIFKSRDLPILGVTVSPCSVPISIICGFRQFRGPNARFQNLSFAKSINFGPDGGAKGPFQFLVVMKFSNFIPHEVPRFRSSGSGSVTILLASPAYFPPAQDIEDSGILNLQQQLEQQHQQYQPGSGNGNGNWHSPSNGNGAFRGGRGGRGQGGRGKGDESRVKDEEDPLFPARYSVSRNRGGGGGGGVPGSYPC